mmetsp:Transcript_44630/g.108212  ORF Transcript_44630/g.108212 Transcript_44630/m.108212 type:complete len:578 (-) Transcript_44630:2624-4357(-)
MAPPFRRGRSGRSSIRTSNSSNGIVEYDDDDDGYMPNDSSAMSTQQQKQSAWEARRRRKAAAAAAAASAGNSGSGAGLPPSGGENNSGTGLARGRSRSQNNGMSRHSSKNIIRSSRSKSSKKDALPDDEYDPYDSDPGESYREHCDRIKGESSRSCLVMPRFLKQLNNGQVGPNSSNNDNMFDKNAAGGTTVATSPPSPLTPMSDIDGGDLPPGTLFGGVDAGSLPASLPRDLARVRYSLRTSVGDGSQPQPQLTSASMMERRELRPNNVHINVSHWSDFGGRNYMEDRYAIEDMGAVQVEVSPAVSRPESQAEAGVEVTYGQQRQNRRLKMPLTWVGCFDGHGGEKAAQFCADWMSSYVRNEETYPFDLGYSMKNAFTAIDEDFVATGHPDGSTACAATLVGGRRIVCSNAGDSRAIVVRRDGTVVRLSRDHKPGMPDETRRISELGGRVIYWGRWRVEGLLAVSRSVGDASLKPYVTAEPEVCEYDIGKDDWFLIISSDGIWDVMDNEEAAHVVIASSCVMEEGKLKIDTNRFKWAARNLCEHAKSCGSTDNFSCIVVDLKSCGNPQAKSGRYLP